MDEKPAAKAPAREQARAKPSYKEQRELEALPGEIEALEAEQKALQGKMSAGDYDKHGAEALKKDRKRAKGDRGGVDGKAGEVGGVGEEGEAGRSQDPIGSKSNDNECRKSNAKLSAD